MNSEIIKLLENNDIKPTPNRMLVLEQLLLHQQNLSISDIETLLYPADRITIYRTLQTFIKKGLVHSIDTQGAVFYALCSSGCNAHIHSDNHPHFFCERCKQTTCNNEISYSIQIPPTSQNYTIHSIAVTIKGICPNCADK